MKSYLYHGFPCIFKNCCLTQNGFLPDQSWLPKLKLMPPQIGCLHRIIYIKKLTTSTESVESTEFSGVDSNLLVTSKDFQSHHTQHSHKDKKWAKRSGISSDVVSKIMMWVVCGGVSDGILERDDHNVEFQGWKC